VAHEVTNGGNDRDQLSNMAGQAKAAMGVEALDVLADRGKQDFSMSPKTTSIGVPPTSV